MPAATKMAKQSKPKPVAERTHEDKERMRKEKFERQEAWVAAADGHRAKVKKMSPAQKQVYYAARAEKGKAKRKRLQGDLIFPVLRMKRSIRSQVSIGKKRKKGRLNVVTTEAAVFTTAVMEYLAAEVLELAGECAVQMKKKRIVPRHIMAAVRMDDELATFIPKSTTFAQAGTIPKAIPTFLASNNVPRKDWNKNWKDNVMNQHHIYRQRMNDSKTGSDVNNNSKKQVK